MGKGWKFKPPPLPEVLLTELLIQASNPRPPTLLPKEPITVTVGNKSGSGKTPHGAKTASYPFLHRYQTRFLLSAACHIFPPLRNNSLPRLTDQGLQKINDLARHYGVSADAVMTLLQALLNSKGTMAQFDHRELGGAGQWMPGGMTMVGDMFNH